MASFCLHSNRNTFPDPVTNDTIFYLPSYNDCRLVEHHMELVL